MAQKFFLDSETLSELREQGIVPRPALALRIIRIAAVFLIIATLSWATLPPSNLSLAGILLIPLAVALISGLAITKIYLSSIPLAPPPLTFSGVKALTALILVIASLIACFVILAQSGLIPGILTAVERLSRDPELPKQMLQSPILTVSLLLVALALVVGIFEIISYHQRNRNKKFHD